MSRRSRIVAIVNITEDSFSDGGRYLAATAALDHARACVEAGADVIELGPASSHPDATRVPADEQIARLAPILDTLREEGRTISVDATEPAVLDWAIDHRAELLNDVRGFPDPQQWERLATTDAKLVVVHSLLGETRATRDAATPARVLESIDRFFEKRLSDLVRAGIGEERLIVDPGMGFFLGRDPRASLAVLQRLPELRARFGRPLFVSVSRKSFLARTTGRETDALGPATLAAELYAARAGADYLRTHDVAALVDGLEVERALDDRIEGPL